MTPHHITTPEAAELLARPDLARLLKPFMPGPKTVSQVAQAQGVSVQSLHYRVQQLHRAGLLRVVGEIPRQGRPIKLYEAVATDFVFTVDLLKPETMRNLSLGESSLQEFTDDQAPEHPGMYFQQSAALYLTPAEAEELANELDALNRKYEGRKGPKRYGLILGLTPLPRPVD